MKDVLFGHVPVLFYLILCLHRILGSGRFMFRGLDCHIFSNQTSFTVSINLKMGAVTILYKLLNIFEIIFLLQEVLP